MNLMLEFTRTEIITLLTLIVGATAWLFRLEGKQKANTTRLVEMSQQLVQFYATKQELTAVKGQLDALAVGMGHLQGGVDRIERKLDTVVTAGLMERGHGHTA